MYLFILLGDLIFILLALANYNPNAFFGTHDNLYFFDFPVFSLLIIINLISLLGTNKLKDFINGMKIFINKKKSYSMIELKRAEESLKLINQTTLLTGGLLFLIGIMIILHTLGDPAALAPNISVALLSILYSIFIVLLFTQMKSKIKGLIISYMDENTHEESVDEVQRLYYFLRSKGLTDRESEVARMVSLELSNKEIGDTLHISVPTVKKHITHILEKTKHENREALTKMIKEERISG